MNPFIEFINDCGEVFFGSAGLMVIQSSVLIAILFGLDFLLRKRIRAVFRYCLWMLVLVKLTLPSSLAAPYSLGYWLGDTVDRVESSLASSGNPSHASVDGVADSWLEPVEVAIDDFPSQILPVTAEGSALPATDVSESTFFIEGPAGSYAVEPAPAVNLVEVLPVRQADSVGDGAIALTWQAVLFVLWLAVCIATGLLVLQKTLLLQKLVRQAPPANKRLIALFESCIKRMRIGRDIGLGVSPIIPTPAVYGLFRPTVLIPERMLTDELDTDELETIFVHELMHIQRGDLWVKLLQTILQVVYFYNPLLWLANATIRRVRELAVDEAVLVILGKSTSQVYPRTLIKVAGWALDQPMHGLRLIGIMESNDLLTERVNIMLDKPIPRSKKVGVIGLLMLFALGVFLLPMARADVAAPETDSSVAEDVAVSDDIAPPEPADGKEIVVVAEMAPGSVRPAGFVDEPDKSVMAEIDALSEQIELLRHELQMMRNVLHQKETELAKMLNAEVSQLVGSAGGMMGGAVGPSLEWPVIINPPVGYGVGGYGGGGYGGGGYGGGGYGGGGYGGGVAGPSSARPADKKPVGYVGGGYDGGYGGGGYGGGVAGPSSVRPANKKPVGYGGMAGAGALPDNISDEVRKELQRILPGLLREILPKLLAEAMNEAAVNNVE